MPVTQLSPFTKDELGAQRAAQDVADKLNVSYFLHSHNEYAATYHLRDALKRFDELAAQMATIREYVTAADAKAAA